MPPNDLASRESIKLACTKQCKACIVLSFIYYFESSNVLYSYNLIYTVDMPLLYCAPDAACIAHMRRRPLANTYRLCLPSSLPISSSSAAAAAARVGSHHNFRPFGTVFNCRSLQTDDDLFFLCFYVFRTLRIDLFRFVC
jgi:hypothetical protein